MLCLFILFLGCIFATESLGFFGQTQQSSDFHVRNAFFDTLVRDDWPLFNAEGHYIVYYLTYWLPSAALARISQANPNLILHLWTLLHFCTLFALLYLRFKHKTLILMGIMFSVSSLFEWVEMPFLLRELAERVPSAQPVFEFFIPLWDYNNGFRYDDLWRQLAFSCFNNGLPVGIFFSLLLAARPRPAAMLHYSSLIVASSPLSALALLPYIGAKLITQVKRIRDCCRIVLSDIAVPSSLLLLTCVTAYLASTYDASQTRFLWQASPLYLDNSQNLDFRIVRYIIIFLLMGSPAWVFLHRQFRHTIAFHYVLLMLLILPLIWVGYENNEFLLKGSVPVFLFLSVLYTLAFSSCRQQWKKRVMLLFFAASSMHFVVDITLRYAHYYSWDPVKREQNIRNDWEGHLNHPGHMYYSRFIGKPSCPVILKTPSE